MMNYRFYWDAYTGQGGFSDGSYLVRYPRETDEKYKRRQELVFYPNLTRKIVETYVSTVFSTSPQRQDLPPEYELFIQDTDLNKTHIDEFMKNLLRLSLVFGTVFVIVDKPKGQALTRLEEREKRLYPYLTIRTPDMVELLELDEYGRITRIVFREYQNYLTFNTAGWVRSKDREGNNVIEAGELGFMPVVAVSWRESLLPTEIPIQPFIHEIAYLNRDLYNAISELREIIRTITFPVFTLPVKDMTAIEELQRQGLTIGTENVILYNPEAGGRPEFIAPPPEPAKVYLEYINMLIELIYKSANLEFVLGVKQEKSGIALEFEFQELNKMLSSLANQMEQAEYKIAKTFMAYYNSDFTGSITYKKDFSFRDVERVLKLAYDTLALNISPTFNNEVYKMIARLVLSEADESTLKRIDNEIDGLEGLDNQLKNEVKFLEGKGKRLKG
ncbi:hypothetical protein [Hydrogenobacter thermophilus]|uniref:hypothetical protein n=1 Tax=Hydrogenobacter thermophilus TaxID=940 RepID=UPI0030F6AAB4